MGAYVASQLVEAMLRRRIQIVGARALALAAAHNSYREAGAAALRGYGRPGHVFCDLENIFAPDESDLRL